MNELSIRPQSNLPTKLEDLAAYVLIGREQLTAVRAAIRAMDKMEVAVEVRKQKIEEARMVSEALLDAEVRIGEITKQIPKATSGNQYSGKMVRCTAATNQNEELRYTAETRSKEERIKDLGFSKAQVHRMETLADNKDLIPQVKAEARENGTLPTRGRVLDLAQKRKQQEESPKLNNVKIANGYNKVIYGVGLISTEDEYLNAWGELLDRQDMIDSYIEMIDQGIPKLLRIKKFLRELKP